MAEPSGLKISTQKVTFKSSEHKPSRFNIRTEDKNGNLLLINTYTGKFTKFESEYKELVTSVINRPNEADKSQPLFSDLINRGYIVPSNANEFNKAELLHTQTIASSDTLMLILLPNENCNFRCTYCYESFAKNFMKQSVQDSIIKFLEKNLYKFKNLHIEWFGGEPLTAPKIIEDLSFKMIELCKKYKATYTAGMTTNGYNLDLKMFRRMSACRIMRYQITVDGTEETHDSQRVRIDGKGTYQRIFTNLINIRDNIKSSAFQVLLRCNISQPVLDNIEEYVESVKREFVNDQRFKLFWQKVGDWGGDSVKTVSLCNDLELHDLMFEEAEKGLDFSYYYNFMKPGGSVCYASKMNNFVIGSDGILYKCTVAFEDELNQVGYLEDTGKMILDIDKYSLWVTGHENQDSSCKKCFFRPSCQGAVCPLYRITNENSSSPCPDIKKNVKDYMRIIAASEQSMLENYSFETVRL